MKKRAKTVAKPQARRRRLDQLVGTPRSDSFEIRQPTLTGSYPTGLVSLQDCRQLEIELDASERERIELTKDKETLMVHLSSVREELAAFRGSNTAVTVSPLVANTVDELVGTLNQEKST